MITVARAYIKNVKVSPKKLRLMLPTLKKLQPSEALDYLMYSPKRPAKILYKALKSVMSNAKDILKTDDRSLHFRQFTIEEGQKLKRYQAGGRGTAKPIMRRFSHIKIILEADEEIAKSEIRSTKSETNPKSKLLKTKKV